VKPQLTIFVGVLKKNDGYRKMLEAGTCLKYLYRDHRNGMMDLVITVGDFIVHAELYVSSASVSAHSALVKSFPIS
jgi:hypothetical protein